ncbi:hypothetical protein JB92DRAFT_2838411 [Gautieria morchelliformis]|nr:hypothetical protein JB92DRAFT_2838411 [Gautieria morchelliformis]
MSYAPTLPPLPNDYPHQQHSHAHHQSRHSKPPVPPLPPNFRPEDDRALDLVAPMPERAMPSLGADMARTLDDSLAYAPAYPAPYAQAPPASSFPSRTSSLYPAPPAIDYRRPSPGPGGFAGAVAPGQYVNSAAPGYPGGFSRPPPRTGPSPAPPHSPYPHPHPQSLPAGFAPPAPYPEYNIAGAMGGMSLGRAQSPPRQPQLPPPQQPGPRPADGAPPALTAPLPTVETLQATLAALGGPGRASSAGPEALPFIRDVLWLVERTVSQQGPATPPAPPALPAPPVLPVPLAALAAAALPMLLAVLTADPASRPWADAVRTASPAGPPQAPAPPAGAVPAHTAEALFLLGTLYAAGHLAAPPAGDMRGPVVPASPRLAFRLFESAARAGSPSAWGGARAWFRVGRDYEAVGDVGRARDCFERGVRAQGAPGYGVGGAAAGGDGTEACLYRLAMANLLGQLGLPRSHENALPFLLRAARGASVEVPQPAYVLGLILLGEFDAARVDVPVLAAAGALGPGTSPPTAARPHIERAAYLGFAPAQYKLGHAYEYAVAPCVFACAYLFSLHSVRMAVLPDSTASARYVVVRGRPGDGLASQQGEPEADMALSKWFLCGAEGAFEKDEALAVVFAEKAARKGLGSAEFAMGYYKEVGVGGAKDIAAARKWYTKAVAHDNPDAPERLRALSQPAPQALSRSEHDAITDAKLVRTRTQARVNAQRAGRVATAPAGPGGEEVLERMRMQHRRESADALPPPHAYEQQPRPEQHQQYQQPPQQPAVSSAHTRYSLTDSPAPMGSGVPPSPAPSQGRAAGRPPGRRQQSNDDAAAWFPHAPNAAATNAPPAHPGSPALSLPPPSGTPPAARPVAAAATFEEMGFKTGKAEDKDCVIM